MKYHALSEEESMPMRSKPSVADVAEHFEEYLHRVVDDGETLVLLRAGQPVAELRPVARGGRLRDLPAILSSLPRLSASEADSFAADLEAARSELAHQTPRDPWAS
jgi:antitoxin (DNA-binding transcriptional repressor) of toxin-antitoxin stability system